MQQKFYYGKISTIDLAQALEANFHTANYRVQHVGDANKIAVQIGTRENVRSGGQTTLTILLQKVPDGISVQVGQQAWLGVAASLGMSALKMWRNPMALLDQIDDIAQDIENLQLTEKVWQIIDQTTRSMNSSHQLSENLRRAVCPFCDSANPVGESNCVACGAPLGSVQPKTCPRCGFAVRRVEQVCPNCQYPL